jgi:hypothetical protein
VGAYRRRDTPCSLKAVVQGEGGIGKGNQTIGGEDEEFVLALTVTMVLGFSTIGNATITVPVSADANTDSRSPGTVFRNSTLEIGQSGGPAYDGSYRDVIGTQDTYLWFNLSAGAKGTFFKNKITSSQATSTPSPAQSSDLSSPSTR